MAGWLSINTNPLIYNLQQKYFSTKDVSRKEAFLPSMAGRLWPESLRSMDDVMSGKNPASCLYNNKIDSSTSRNTKQVIETVECRVSFVYYASFDSDVYILHEPEE